MDWWCGLLRSFSTNFGGHSRTKVNLICEVRTEKCLVFVGNLRTLLSLASSLARDWLVKKWEGKKKFISEILFVDK